LHIDQQELIVMGSNYAGTRRSSNFVKPETQTVAEVDFSTLVHPNFKAAFVEVCDFGAKGVTVEVMGKIGNMNASYKFGDAGTRLAGKSVVAYVGITGLARSSNAKEEAWSTSKATGDNYRIIKFGSKSVQITSDFDVTAAAPQSAF